MLNTDEGAADMSWEERRHKWLYDEVQQFPMTMLGPSHFGPASLVRNFPQETCSAANTFKAGDVMSEVNTPNMGDDANDLQFQMVD